MLDRGPVERSREVHRHDEEREPDALTLGDESALPLIETLPLDEGLVERVRGACGSRPQG